MFFFFYISFRNVGDGQLSHSAMSREPLFAAAVAPDPNIRATGSTTCRSFLRVCLFLCIACAVVYVPLFYTVTVREGI